MSSIVVIKDKEGGRKNWPSGRMVSSLVNMKPANKQAKDDALNNKNKNSNTFFFQFFLFLIEGQPLKKMSKEFNLAEMAASRNKKKMWNGPKLLCSATYYYFFYYDGWLNLCVSTNRSLLFVH